MAKFANGTSLPQKIIEFDTQKLEFKVESNDLAHKGKSDITVSATTIDPRFAQYEFNTTFTLEMIESFENTPPRFDNFDSTTNAFTFIRGASKLTDETLVAGVTWQ